MKRYRPRNPLSRRTFLRGAGAAMALPLLDAMVPAATALANTSAKPVRRLGYVFMPMGADMSRWTPKTEKSGDRLNSDRLNGDLSPILQSLAPVKDKISVISNLELANPAHFFLPPFHLIRRRSVRMASHFEWTFSGLAMKPAH